MNLEPVLKRVDDDFDAAVERLSDLLRIPSISTDPDHDADTRRAAEWLVEDLRSMGFNAGLRETAGHPMVVATHDGPPGEDVPRILFYGHYDVQPADPLELWESGPFEPVLRPSTHGPGRAIVARGAVDDKGQVMTFIEAFRAWHAVHGGLPIAVTVMLEGEEESGSASLEPFLRTHADELRADACVVCDTGMWDIDTPAITSMLRGMVYVEAVLHGPSRDLHSGVYGGNVVNPCNALVEALAGLHDAEGRVAIPGFYDDVREVPADELRRWNALPFDEQAFMNGIGMTRSHGEKGRSPLERMWSRPTLDVNGLYGGYTGKGAKTVIGSHAGVKLSCRLVPDQDPARIRDAVHRWLEERTPPDCRWTFHDHGCNPAIRVPTESVHLRAAASALKRVFGREPALIGTGGSIPAVGAIQRILGIDSLLVGFGLEDDRVHSPNEKFELQCMLNGIRSHATMLDAFAALRT